MPEKFRRTSHTNPETVDRTNGFQSKHPRTCSHLETRCDDSLKAIDKVYIAKQNQKYFAYEYDDCGVSRLARRIEKK